MTATAITMPPLGPGWRQLDSGSRDVRLRYTDNDGVAVELGARRCAEGRLRDTYPVSAHDVEIYTGKDAAPQALPEPLGELSRAIMAADPECRRVVFAASVGDLDAVAAAQAAGFRYVLDVDVPDAELSLLVAEPDWVSDVDADLDRVPGV
jgi:hypothetical protein